MQQSLVDDWLTIWIQNYCLPLTTAVTAVESKMFLVQTETKDQYEESPQIFESEVDVVTESNGENLFESEVGPDSSEKVLMNVDIIIVQTSVPTFFQTHLYSISLHKPFKKLPKPFLYLETLKEKI